LLLASKWTKSLLQTFFGVDNTYQILDIIVIIFISVIKFFREILCTRKGVGDKEEKAEET
jgi:hypothetical protein